MQLDNAAFRSLDEQVAGCIAIRDAGDPQKAHDLLRSIVDAAPDHLGATLELLLIAVTAGTSDLPDSILARMPADLQTHPHISLMTAYHHEQHGRITDVIRCLARVSHESVASIPTFATLRRRLLTNLIISDIAITAPLATVLPGAETEHIPFALAEAILQHICNAETDPDELFRDLRAWSFQTPGWLNQRVDVFARVLARLPDYMSVQMLSTAFSYLVAARSWDEASAMARRLLARPESSGDPIFAKALATLADEGDNSLAEAAGRIIASCSARGADPTALEDHRAFARLNMIEVRARKMRNGLRPPEDFSTIGALAPTYSARSTPSGLHFYIGLFGQMRFGNYLLGPLAAYLNDQFAGFVEKQNHLSFGIATWEQSGQRELREEDGYVFLQNLLPFALLERLDRHRLESVGQALAFIPNVTRRLQSECRTTQCIDANSLRSLFHPDALVAIENDATFQAEFGRRLTEVFGESVTVANQGRMWNRIAAHRALVKQTEQRTGRPVTHVILLRGDLVDIHGPLWRHIESRIDSNSSNWAMFDHDPHASFIGGVGDRFMIVDRDAFDRLVDGYDLMRSIVAPDTPVDHSYRVRFEPHTFLRTVLFEHATKIYEIKRSDVVFDIYRGRRTIEQLREEIARDAIMGENPEFRNFLKSLIN